MENKVLNENKIKPAIYNNTFYKKCIFAFELVTIHTLPWQVTAITEKKDRFLAKLC